MSAGIVCEQSQGQFLNLISRLAVGGLRVHSFTVEFLRICVFPSSMLEWSVLQGWQPHLQSRAAALPLARPKAEAGRRTDTTR